MAAGVTVAAGMDDPVFSGVTIVKSSSVIKVFYSADDSRYAKVSILDSKGNIIFYDVVKARKGFKKAYHVDNLLPGQYEIRVTGSNGSQSQLFEVTAVQAAPYSVVRLRQPGKYLVSIPSGKARVARINVFDEELNLLYSRIEKLNGDFAKVYHVKGGSGIAHITVSGL